MSTRQHSQRGTARFSAVFPGPALLSIHIHTVPESCVLLMTRSHRRTPRTDCGEPASFFHPRGHPRHCPCWWPPAVPQTGSAKGILVIICCERLRGQSSRAGAWQTLTTFPQGRTPGGPRPSASWAITPHGAPQRTAQVPTSSSCTWLSPVSSNSPSALGVGNSNIGH